MYLSSSEFKWVQVFSSSGRSPGKFWRIFSMTAYLCISAAKRVFTINSYSFLQVIVCSSSSPNSFICWGWYICIHVFKASCGGLGGAAPAKIWRILGVAAYKAFLLQRICLPFIHFFFLFFKSFDITETLMSWLQCSWIARHNYVCNSNNSNKSK